MSKPIVAVLALVACACGSASPAAPLQPTTHYRLSGVVTDITAGSPIVNAAVTMQITGAPLKTTRSNSSGEYLIEFDTSISIAERSGLIAVSPESFHSYWTNVQVLSLTSTDTVKNVRLRPVRTLAAGQSITLSIEPDSSLAWDPDWDPWVFPSLNKWEEFKVSAPADGVMTVDVRSETGGPTPTVNCQSVECPTPAGRGTVSLSVRSEWGPRYFNIAIPRADVPQRYEISASRH